MAEYTIRCNAGSQDENVRNVLLTFDPGAVVGPGGDVGLDFDIRLEVALHVDARLSAPNGAVLREELVDDEILDPRYRPEDRDRRVREGIRLACLRLMERFTGRAAGPWGILTGVRPTKVFALMAGLGFSSAEIRERLSKVYALAPDKVDLLCTVARAEEPFLNVKPNQIALYLGIPFCPTRCFYCSFASYPLETHGHQVAPFQEALVREISSLADLAARLGLEVNSIYVGGGTPTVLSPVRLEELLACLGRHFEVHGLADYTVEAGRPDTFTAGHMDAMLRHGVRRVSVNPQTMNQATLQRLGRNHTVDQVCEAFHMARESGFRVINMDLIAGLPGETPADMADTLRAVESLGPDNLTVHTLAIKRASSWRRQVGEMSFPRDDEVGEMLRLSARAAAGMGMHPYYLYRQRFILANLENVGYSIPGSESPYNIQMIEERQTVIAMGGGGVTRMVDPATGAVSRLFNPKCPATYVHEIEGLIARKVRSIEALFR